MALKPEGTTKMEAPTRKGKTEQWAVRRGRALHAGISLLVIVGGVFLRLYLLGSQALWLDETFSVMVAQETDLFEVIQWMSRDIHPVLYYVGLHLFLRLLGNGEFAVRFFSWLAGSLTLIAVPFVGKDLGLKKPAILLATVLLAISPLHIYYSQEARMYALLALETLLAVGAFYLAISHNRFRDWAFYVGVTALAFHTHIYAFFLLPVEALYLLWCRLRKVDLPHQLWKHYLLAQGVLFLSALPYLWVLEVWWNSPSKGGVQVATPAQLLKAWETLSSGMTAMPTAGMDLSSNRPLQVGGMVLLAGLVLLALLPDRSTTRKLSPIPLLALAVILPPLLIVLVSWTLQQRFWVLRGMTMFAPLAYLLAGIGAARLKSRPFCLCVTFFFAAISFFNLYPHYNVRIKSNLPRVVEQMRSQVQPGDILALDPWYYIISLDYYYTSTIPELGYYFDGQDHFVDIEAGYKNAHLIEAPPYLQNAERVWLMGPVEDISGLCQYAPGATFLHLDEEGKGWVVYGPCLP